MSTEQKCRAKNPATCKFHGASLQIPAEPVNKVDSSREKTKKEKETPFTILKEGSAPREIFEMFIKVNDDVKNELCGKDDVVDVEDTSELKTGYSYECSKCGKTHYFTSLIYDQTVGRKAMTYLFRQLPDEKKKSAQFVNHMMSLQMASLDQSFTHYYKDGSHKANLLQKSNNRLKNISHLKDFNDIDVPQDTHNQDWTSYTSAQKALNALPYIEPSEVPKEILYKFSQCLRKKQHETAEAAQESLVSHKQDGFKEVYACPHCKKFHYGTELDPNRTDEERYEFAKKTWALPDYRAAVSLVIQSYGLKK